MKKTVQIVTIPLNKEGWSKGDLLFTGTTYKVCPVNKFRAHDWKAQQLLVLSDDEIKRSGNLPKVGDYCYRWFDKSINEHTGQLVKYKIGLEKDSIFLNKIIASYPQIEGTLSISKETVEAWIDTGIPREGSVEMEIDCQAYYGHGGHDCHTPCSCKTKYKVQEYPFSGDAYPKNNLLLEFGKKGYSSKKFKNIVDNTSPEIKERIKNWFDEQDIKAGKPPIPTDEEIEKKANENADKYLKKLETVAVFTGYIDGYKQALKDMGYE
jgi:gas vesicle protein